MAVSQKRIKYILSKKREDRTVKEVEELQGSIYGCCDRHADNQACDCISLAKRMQKLKEAKEAEEFGEDIFDQEENGPDRISLPSQFAKGEDSAGPYEYELIRNTIISMIEWIGDDPKREGLLETPDRVWKSWQEIFAGYGEDVSKHFKVFDVPCDEMVLMRGIEFYSWCEHHMLPFTGVAHIAYLPNKKVIGASKLARILDVYAKRLQVQERLTKQVTEALTKYLKPKGAACVIEASHACMMCRGVKKHNAVMVTSSLTGPFKTDDKTRAEFYQLIRGV